MIARELRRHSLLTQEQVAEKLGWAQSAVAWVEQQDVRSLDVVLVAQYVEALGGRLEAAFGAVRVSL